MSETVAFWKSLGYSRQRAEAGTYASPQLLHITLDQLESDYAASTVS